MEFTGQLVTGDFEDNTMTFEIEGKMTLQAGKYEIRQIEVGNNPKPKRSMHDEHFLLNKAVNALEDYLNAGSKEKREQASILAKEVYKKYHGMDYKNRIS